MGAYIQLVFFVLMLSQLPVFHYFVFGCCCSLLNGRGIFGCFCCCFVVLLLKSLLIVLKWLYPGFSFPVFLFLVLSKFVAWISQIHNFLG